MRSVQKASLLVGILAIVGGGTFVYFDPLDLDLLGLKQKSAVAQPAAPKHIAVPAAQPPAAAPKAAVPQIQTKASAVPSPTPSPAPAASSRVAAPKAAVAPTQAKAPASAAPTTPSPVSAPVAVAPAAPAPVAEAAAQQPPMKLSEEAKTAGKPAIDKPTRPKNLDLRHCLDLETDAAIAKCAGE